MKMRIQFGKACNCMNPGYSTFNKIFLPTMNMYIEPPILLELLAKRTG